MNDDREWEQLSQKVFSRADVQARPFLWTRILAAIEKREQELAVWWGQWRWMGRVAAAMTLLVTVTTGAVFYETSQGVPLESLLHGITTPQQSAQLSTNPPNTEEVVAWLTGGASWEEN